jgi:hypothetical protein
VWRAVQDVDAEVVRRATLRVKLQLAYFQRTLRYHQCILHSKNTEKQRPYYYPGKGLGKKEGIPSYVSYNRAMNNHRVRTSSAVTQLFMRRTKSVVMSLQTIKEGHLYKRGKINTEWRMRMFVLNGKQLAYFKGGVSECRGWSGCFSSLSFSPSPSPRILCGVWYSLG